MCAAVPRRRFENSLVFPQKIESQYTVVASEIGATKSYLEDFANVEKARESTEHHEHTKRSGIRHR